MLTLTLLAFSTNAFAIGEWSKRGSLMGYSLKETVWLDQDEYVADTSAEFSSGTILPTISVRVTGYANLAYGGTVTLESGTVLSTGITVYASADRYGTYSNPYTHSSTTAYFMGNGWATINT